MKRNETTYNEIIKNKLTNIQKRYDFICDPNVTPTKNFTNSINSLSKTSAITTNTMALNETEHTLHLQPKNLSVHNLCNDYSLPLGTQQLLGLGLKYCVSTAKPNPNLKQCLKKLAYRIRTKHWLLHQNPENTTPFIPQLYVKLKGWNPPPATSNTEHCMTEFEKKLKKAVNLNTRKIKYISNLNHNQQQTLNKLRSDDNIIIMPTDKNLGPAIMNRNRYIEQCLTEHLLTPQYCQLTKKTALTRIESTKNLLLNNLQKYKNQLSSPELTYFTRSCKAQHRMPIFYGMPKVHKNPTTLRPVVSCINSYLSIFSNWLDFKMKDLLFLIPSYIKDSRHLLSDLKHLQLPPNAKLFTADATAMYTNIDTNTGIWAFEMLFSEYSNLIPNDFPRELFLNTLRVVMENNIFKFGDTYWLQTQGTAMGTPAAPLYSILTYGYYENTTILNNFKGNLLYYKRFIDDIFGIWIDDDNSGKDFTQCLKDQTKTWENFKNTLNQFGSLKWNVESLTKSTNFLDITITIKDKQLTTVTYQKPLNLYLYIPPLSAHPSSCFKGLITGELYRYWWQNTEEKDFIDITTKFIQRLINRGHQPNNIIPLIQTAASNIDSLNIKASQQKTTDDETLYIHWRHHPSNIPKRKIRQIYDQTLRGNDGYHNMTLAVSRPKNLRDMLCRTDLHDTPGKNVSDILDKTLREHPT